MESMASACSPPATGKTSKPLDLRRIASRRRRSASSSTSSTRGVFRFRIMVSGALCRCAFDHFLFYLSDGVKFLLQAFAAFLFVAQALLRRQQAVVRAPVFLQKRNQQQRDRVVAATAGVFAGR